MNVRDDTDQLFDISGVKKTGLHRELDLVECGK